MKTSQGSQMKLSRMTMYKEQAVKSAGIIIFLIAFLLNEENIVCFFRRPQRVCWCSYLPDTPITINGKIIILQHPDEEKRNLKTGPMLFHGMTSGQCLIFYGKKFPSAKHQGLKEMLMEPHTYVLYPGPQSKSITAISDTHPKGEPYNLVLIDGTWQQAKSMYFHSHFLHSLPQVQSIKL